MTLSRAVLAAALLVSGCATLGGTRQVVSIDTPVRGAVVHDDDGKVLGTTPFFARVKRSRTLELHWSRPDAHGDHRQEFGVRCRYRWKDSLLPNAATASVSVLVPPLFVAWLGTAVVTDLISGAAWQCPDGILLPDEAAASLPAPATPPCRVVAIAPPKHDDEGIARQIADAWWAATPKAACDRRTDLAETEKLLRRQGVTAEKGLAFERYRRGHLNELGVRTGATHLVVLDVKPEGDRVKGQAVVRDMHTLKAEPAAAVDLDLGIGRQPWYRRAARWIGRNVQLLPDSVGYAPTQREYQFVPNGGNDYVEDRASPSWVPAVLTNFTLLSVDHPGPYQPWDATLRFGPRVLLGLAERDLDYGVHTAPVQKAAVRMFEAGGLFGATATVHTPLGAGSAFAGLGAAGTWHWRDGRYVGVKVPVVGGLGTALTAFVSENVFLRVDVTMYRSSTPALAGAGYELTQWATGTVALGWYVPEWRGVVRSWF
ncbi:MAG: hypothetical protein FJ100_08445 [Deltaproteobacteria bacterium]|nr:hypothetical protein [Deltaproteobacteria bacterium]